MNESGGKLMGADKRVGNSGRRATSRWVRGTTLTAVIAIGLGGCSSLPDWANPVDWYDSAFSTDGTAPPQSTRKVADASDSKSFPALKSVPAKAPATSSDADRATVTSGLIADRDKAKYTDEDLRSGGKTSAQLATRTAPKPMPKPVPQKQVMKQVAAAPAAAPRPVAPAPMSAAPQPVPVKPVNPRLSRLPKLASAAAPQPVPPIAPAPLPPLTAPAVTAKMAPMPTPTSVVSAPARVATTPPPAPLPPLISGAAPAPVQVAGNGYVTPTMAAPSFPNAGQNALSQMFAASLAQSASTVSTAPASSTFNSPVAQPINAGQSSLPGIVLAAYNDPLTGKSPASVTVNPGAALVSAPASARKLVVHFGNGSSKLGRKAKKELRTAAEAYKTNRRGVIRVVGHASHFTKNMNLARHRMINFRVSLDRANEVARELMRNGVDASAVRVEAVSDADPVYFEHMPEGQSHNRRAEIFLEF
ncbi:MAG: OmpA family protein [Alphaproteobacteria bacterium]|nr:OmpA family protein [Alphaproteobacteria bacterium]MBT4084152.1 OmpA family protein [Alphaproteobacteria bacterium]MBT7747737.1 OmpA family protein [Alphaproteobacteria bacterium]